MTQLCEYCQRWSGIYLAGNHCCTVRDLALSPKSARQACYAAVRARDGEDALARLRTQVEAEYRRWQAYRATKKESP